MTLIDSPVILPEWVAQVSARIDLAGAEPPELLVPGIRLPRRLRAAVRARQLEFLAGRACAAEAIAKLEPRRARSVPGVLRSGAPRFPPSLTGSITHTRGFVSAAVARRSDVAALGIDSEIVAGRRRASRVMERVATGRELQAALRNTGLDREVAVTLLFSAKESLFKALHPIVRCSIDFLAARIEVCGGESSGTLRAVLRATLAGCARGDAFDGRFQIRSGYVHTGIVIPTR